MIRQVALLRGVNVGGHNKLPMKELAALLESVGCRNVQTYIQSGNIVYDGAVSGDAVGAAIEKKFGFRPPVFVIPAAGFKKAMEDCPYRRDATKNPKSVHLLFLASIPDASVVKTLNDTKTPEETFAIGKNVLYLHSPNGLAASKIAEKADRILKTAVTSRNWNTVCALVEMTRKEA